MQWENGKYKIGIQFVNSEDVGDRGAKQGGGLGGRNSLEFWRGGFNRPPDLEKKN